MQELLKIVDAVGEVINVVSRIVNGGGIFQVFALTDELSALSNLKKDELIAKVKSLSAEDRLQLRNALKAKVSIENKALEAKIEGGADLLDEAIEVAIDAVAIIQHGKAIAAKAQALLA